MTIKEQAIAKIALSQEQLEWLKKESEKRDMPMGKLIYLLIELHMKEAKELEEEFMKAMNSPFIH